MSSGAEASTNVDVLPAIRPRSANREDKWSDFAVLYRGPELVVVDKPHDVAMDGARSDESECTVERWVARGPLATDGFLSERLPEGACTVQGGGRPVLGDKALKFVHQLDYATSGVLCLAFSRDMAAAVAHCFEFRHTRKEYSALLCGWIPDAQLPLRPARPGAASPAEDSAAAATVACGGRKLPKQVNLAAAVLDDALGAAVLDWPIEPDPTDPEGFRMRVPAAAESTEANGEGEAPAKTRAQEAVTVLNVLGRGYTTVNVLGTDGTVVGTERLKTTHVRLRLFTGRRHQLRVHCATFGFPIVGDATYAPAFAREARSADDPSTLAAGRMMLHALRLRIGLDVAAHTRMTAAERNKAKRVRRRETNGFDPIMDDDALPHTDFASSDRLLEHFVLEAASGEVAS